MMWELSLLPNDRLHHGGDSDGGGEVHCCNRASEGPSQMNSPNFGYSWSFPRRDYRRSTARVAMDLAAFCVFSFNSMI